MDGLELRSATEKDYEFLFRLKRATMKAYVEQTWGWDEAWQQERFRQTFDPSYSQIVLLDGEDIGVLRVESKGDEVFLAVIKILPAYQRRGIGTKLIRSVQAEALKERLPVTLQVIKVNPARILYERLGFELVGETETHYLMKALPGR